MKYIRIFFLLPIISCSLQGQALTMNNQQAKQVSVEAMDTGVSEKNRAEIIDIIKKLQADTFVVYTKTLQFHWNATGPLFVSLHAFFKDLYEELFSVVDMLAERIRALGGMASGPLQEFGTLSQISQETGAVHTSQEMIAHLLTDYETIIRSLRIAIDQSDALADTGTSNFLADLLVKNEKKAWMLRAQLS